MDPITLEKMLSIVDAIEDRREGNQLTSSAFSQIIVEQTRAKDLARREQDILRILNAMGWIVPGEAGMLCLTQRYTDFISAWDEGELLRINQGLANYPPYASFSVCLRKERAIRIPRRQDKESRQELGRRLKKKYDITFVAFDTFRVWAVAVGQAYLSPFEESLYWGGNWDDHRPSLETFKDACWKSYYEANKTSGYANIGRLADVVCRRLNISFQTFEIKINMLVKTEPNLFVLAPATIRAPSRLFQVVTMRPRSEVLKERLAARLLNQPKKPAKSKWLEHRYLEDGIRINRRLVKLIRWEDLYDAHR